MSKIFEALENARMPALENVRARDRSRVARFDVVAPAPAPSPSAPASALPAAAATPVSAPSAAPAALASAAPPTSAAASGPSLAHMPIARRANAPFTFSRVDMEDEMIRLHQSLDGMLTTRGARVIQFTAARPGEGTSTVVREYARVCATRFGQRVLLLEMDKPESAGSLRGQERVPAPIAPLRVGDTSLYVARLPQDVLVPSSSAAAREPAPSSPWERFRELYHLVLLDAPPATASPLCLAMSAHVDGVVLIVEAEHTRWPVARSAKESLERSGARVLGIVFNKRRYYIPAFVYNEL